MANAKRRHVCAVEVSSARRRTLSEACLSKIRAVSGITDGVGRCPEDGGTGAVSRGGVAYRSAQDRGAWVLVRRSPGGSDEHPFCERLYRAVDAADKQSCRPDFAVAIYPGHLSLSAAEWDAKQGAKRYALHYPANADKDLTVNPDVPVTRQTPPTFLLQAEDDHVDNVNDSLAYYIALKNAGVPVEMHLYAQGGHAFGLRRTKLPITGWPQLVETWLGTIGMTWQ